MGLNDKSRKRNAGSWRERIQDGEAASRPQTERKKRPAPRPSYPGLPQEDPGPAVIPGPTRRTRNSRSGSSRHDTPPPRPRRAARPAPQEEYEDYPEAEGESRSARAGRPRKPRFTIFGALLFVLLMPFRFIGSLTRNIRWFISWPLRILLGCCFVGIVIGSILVFLYGTISNRYDISEVKSNIPERTVILDRKNRTIGTLHGENRKRVSLREVPPIFIDALILREDNRFYDHGGVDWIGVGRAFAQVLKHKRATQGASTLTMQLAKITYNHRERNLHSKLTEVALAKRIEATYTKDEILETYINRIFWGHTFLGIAAAARGYYDKEPRDLSLAECALLAGLPQGPSFLNPLRHPERALERRNRVLRRLEEEGMFPADMVNRALQEPLFSAGMEEGRQPAAPHVTAALMHAGRTGEVRTTLDASLQRGALEIVRRELERLKGHHVTQAAVVVAENATGNILCLVGSANRKHPAGGLMDGTSLPRSPGSALKPFVYAQAFVLGAYPGTVLPDVPTTYRSAHGLEAPQNYNRRNFHGRLRRSEFI
mgnify:FL=1